MAHLHPDKTLAVGIASRGLTKLAPLGGVGRSARGYVMVRSAVALEYSPEPLLSTTSLDSFGTPRLVDDTVVDMRFDEVHRSVFAHPDREYTGYGADGFWYTSGVLDPTHVPFQATWASEAASSTRGTLDRFPQRVLTVASEQCVCLMDADTLDVWMRFLPNPTPPPGLGSFLGGPTTVVRSAAFINGFLIVATNEGVRVANFQKNEAYALRTSGSKLSTLTLANRNDATFMDGAALLAVLSSNDCLDVDAEYLSKPSGTLRRGYTLCAVANGSGFDGIVLAKPGITYPEVKSTVITRTFASAWSVYDDGNGDSTSPYFVDAGSNWVALQVAPGDVLTTDDPTIHPVTKVEHIVPGSRLSLTPELDVSASGASYTIQRRCSRVKISPQGWLYLANGENRLTLVKTTDWFEGGTAVFTNLSTGHATTTLNATAGRLVDFAVTEDGNVYVATDIGIFYVSATDLEGSRAALFTYSTPSSTSAEALYKILEGEGEECSAVAVDPETGNVLVAVHEYEGSVLLRSVVTEINPNIHKAFRYFDRVGVVYSLLTYRNPAGPPDRAVS